MTTILESQEQFDTIGDQKAVQRLPPELAAELAKHDFLKQVNSRTVPAAARFDS